MYQKEKNFREEFMYNIIVQIIMFAIVSIVLAWPMQMVVNWMSISFDFGTTINIFEGMGFVAIGIALYHFIPILPMPFQFNKKD